MMEERTLYRKAIDKWGKEAQVDMIIEECAELILALQKLRRADDEDYDLCICDVWEEIADVEIMLGQARLLFNPNGNAIDSFKARKIERLKQRLEVAT